MGGRDGCGGPFVGEVLKTIRPGRPTLGPCGVVDSAVISNPLFPNRSRDVLSWGPPAFRLIGCQGRDAVQNEALQLDGSLDHVEVFVETEAHDAGYGIGQRDHQAMDVRACPHHRLPSTGR